MKISEKHLHFMENSQFYSSSNSLWMNMGITYHQKLVEIKCFKRHNDQKLIQNQTYNGSKDFLALSLDNVDAALVLNLQHEHLALHTP